MYVTFLFCIRICDINSLPHIHNLDKYSTIFSNRNKAVAKTSTEQTAELKENKITPNNQRDSVKSLLFEDNEIKSLDSSKAGILEPHNVKSQVMSGGKTSPK